MKNRITIENVVFGALLTTMAIVTKTLFEVLPLPDVVKRVELFIVFIIVAGILLGPIYGALSGFVTDIVYVLTFGGVIGLFTLAHVLVGLIPGLIYYLIKYGKVNLAITLIISILTYFTINTIALDILKYIPANYITVSGRLLRTVAVLPLQYFLVYILVADKRFSHFAIHQRFNKRHNI